MKTTTLPELTEQELHILLGALDELPGKLSRVLHNKIVKHVEDYIARMEKIKQEIAVNQAKQDIAKSEKELVANGSASRQQIASMMEQVSKAGA